MLMKATIFNTEYWSFMGGGGGEGGGRLIGPLTS